MSRSELLKYVRMIREAADKQRKAFFLYSLEAGHMTEENYVAFMSTLKGSSNEIFERADNLITCLDNPRTIID